MVESTVHLKIWFFLSQKFCIKRQKEKISFILPKSWMHTSDVNLFHCQLWCWSREAQMFIVQLNDANRKLLFLSDTNEKPPFMSLTVVPHPWFSYQVTSSSFLSLFYFPLLAEDFGHHLLFFVSLFSV